MLIFPIVTRHIRGGTTHVKADHRSHRVGVVAAGDVIILVIRGHSISNLHMRTMYPPMNTGNVAWKLNNAHAHCWAKFHGQGVLAHAHCRAKFHQGVPLLGKVSSWNASTCPLLGKVSPGSASTYPLLGKVSPESASACPLLGKVSPGSAGFLIRVFTKTYTITQEEFPVYLFCWLIVFIPFLKLC